MNLKQLLQRVLESIVPIIGLGIFIAIFIVGFIFLSYFIAAIALIGFILFIIAYVRIKINLRRVHKHQQQKSKKDSGRVIDHDDQTGPH